MKGVFARAFAGKTTFPLGSQPIYSERTIVGTALTHEAALGLVAVWACVRAIAEDIASLPAIIYRRDGENRKDRAPDHWLYPLLHDTPNRDMTAFTFFETLMGHLLTWGNAYVEIERNGFGEVIGLHPLRPDWMRVAWEGEKAYYYRDSGGREQRIPARKVLHVPGFGGDGLIGYSPIRLHRETLAFTKTTNEYGARTFANGVRPDVLLRHPKTMSDNALARLRRSIEERHRGAENAGRMMVLEEGIEVTTVGFPPEDAQFLETRKLQRNEVATIFRMPPHKVGDLERATFSNIEHQSLEYVQDTLRPWARRWERAVRKDLLQDEPDVFLEFLFDDLLRADTMTRFNAYATGIQNAFMTPNQARGLENWNPLPGGDELRIQLNTAPAAPVADVPSAVDTAMKSLSDALARPVNVEVNVPRADTLPNVVVNVPEQPPAQVTFAEGAIKAEPPAVTIQNDVHLPPPTAVRKSIERDPQTGAVIGLTEVPLDA